MQNVAETWLVLSRPDRRSFSGSRFYNSYRSSVHADRWRLATGSIAAHSDRFAVLQCHVPHFGHVDIRVHVQMADPALSF